MPTQPTDGGWKLEPRLSWLPGGGGVAKKQKTLGDSRKEVNRSDSHRDKRHIFFFKFSLQTEICNHTGYSLTTMFTVWKIKYVPDDKFSSILPLEGMQSIHITVGFFEETDMLILNYIYST